jgi:RNA polymerase sigma-70 factor (ECF subfamily)
MLIYLAMIDSDADKSKFEIIYNSYKNLMLYQANKILGDTNDTEDVVHESFLKIIKIIDEIEVAKCPKTRNLVVTIVERTAIDLYRRRQKVPIVAMDEEYINVPEPKDIEDLHDKTDLAAAMAMLPTRYREVLLLRYDSGFTEAEVAVILSMSQENVHKTVQRAKKKLGEILERQEA